MHALQQLQQVREETIELEQQITAQQRRSALHQFLLLQQDIPQEYYNFIAFCRTQHPCMKQFLLQEARDYILQNHKKNLAYLQILQERYQ